MATSKAKKTGQLDKLKAQFENAAGIAFIKFNEATVEEVQTVRRACRAKGMTYSVLKKTLMSVAAKETGKAEFSAGQLDGAVAVIVSPEDEIAPAAAIKGFHKEFLDKKTKTSKFDFAGAVFDGEFLDEAAARTLGDTPSREESIGKIVGMLRSGPQGIHAGLTFGLKGITAACRDADKWKTS